MGISIGNYKQTQTMKKNLVIMAVLGAGAVSASAEELSISTTFAWESQYVFRGVGLAEDTFMPSVDLSYGGLYAGVWAALPVDTAYGNEVDLYGGYAFDVSETIGLDFGATYYTYPDAQDDFFDSDVNTFEVFAGVNFALAFEPSVYVYYDFDLEALTFEVAGGQSFDVSDVSAVEVSAALGYVEPDAGSGYYYYSLGAAYVYNFTDAAYMSLFTNFYGSEEETMIGADKTELSFGFAFGAGF